MNLIQLKQIDGLITTLNALAKGLFDLEEAVTGQLERTNRIYDYLEIQDGTNETNPGKYIEIYGGSATVTYENEIDYINGSGTFNNVKLGVDAGNSLFNGNVFASEVHANTIVGNVESPEMTADNMVAHSYVYVDGAGRSFNVMDQINPVLEYYTAAGTNYPLYLGDDEKFVVVENDNPRGYEFDIHLPLNPQVGQKVMIKTVGSGIGQIHRGLNTFHICPHFSWEKIDGNRSWAITGNYGYAEFMYNGVQGGEWSMLRSSPGAFDIKYLTEPDPQLVNTSHELLRKQVDYIQGRFDLYENEIIANNQLIAQNSGLIAQNSGLIAQNSALITTTQNIIDQLSGFNLGGASLLEMLDW